ncbi:hypothetical protein HPB51_027582 [Rhipicephalus microplus]|uniref:Endonuclease/exonuclease/phosphatase domain-containing protein n=1 Tax=Rhipicephalus microplus TaxID=6941 RepID=A0A9J6CZQ4_RHIMP|nr:hypothetical protein HPB51_027582 [Rhipicephalus microplus]
MYLAPNLSRATMDKYVDEAMEKYLKQRTQRRPLVIVGDFNVDVIKDDRTDGEFHLSTVTYQIACSSTGLAWNEGRRQIQRFAWLEHHDEFITPDAWRLFETPSGVCSPRISRLVASSRLQMERCGTADSLSRQKALELFFSLPDESDTSEDEAESSDDEFVPELAPRDSSGDEDEPGPSTGKRKRRRQRTAINRKRASQDSMEHDVEADAAEEEIGEEWVKVNETFCSAVQNYGTPSSPKKRCHAQ